MIVLYHPRSEHSGLVEDFASEFERYKSKRLELISLETIEGSDLARIYDATAYPTVLAMSEDGSLQRMWQGLPLPLMDEISYFYSI